MSATNDIKRGKDALMYFHNASIKFPSYDISFERLIQILAEKSHDQFLSGFGFAIVSAEISERDVRAAMERLALKAKGQIPARWVDFFNALNKDPSGFSFEAVGATIKGSLSDIGSGFKKVGDISIETLKNAGSLVTYLPYVAFAGVIAFVWFRVKR